MIFVTVGEQLPFDRLIRAVDAWAGSSGEDVFAQTGRSAFIPVHMAHSDFLSPEKFREMFRKAELVVAHAGMGTIISALEIGTPILVMPRRVVHGELRSDHQLATARRFKDLNYVSVAVDENDLAVKLDNFRDLIKGRKGRVSSGPSPELIKTIREFVEAS